MKGMDIVLYCCVHVNDYYFGCYASSVPRSWPREIVSIYLCKLVSNLVQFYSATSHSI